MTAKVEIINEQKTDILTVPASYISKKWGRTTVSVRLSGDVIEQRDVELGISDGLLTEVLAWLTENETIVKEMPTVSKTTTTTSWFPGMGGGGWSRAGWGNFRGG